MVTLYIDLDGTLVDVQRRHYQAYAETLRELGLPRLSEHAYWSGRLDGASNIELIGTESEQFQQRFLSRWLQHVESPAYLRLDTLIPAARRTLSTLAQSHELILVTLRRDRNSLIGQMSELALGKFFSAIYNRDDGRGVRSKVEIIRLFAGEVSPTSVVVGDSEADVYTAKVLGLSSVCVTSGVRSRRFLEPLRPDEVITSIARLPSTLTRFLSRPPMPAYPARV